MRGCLIGLAVALALIAWLATRDGGDSAEGRSGGRIVSEYELAKKAQSIDHPIYWAGPVAGTTLELTEISAGVQVRYLEQGSEASESLTVVTYPRKGAEAELRAFAERPGSQARKGAGGRVVVTSEKHPTSVYFSAAAGAVQVEVYDPTPERALSLARSTRVRPIK